MDEPVRIVVYGEAKTQGSPMVRVNPKTGRAYVAEDTRDGRGFRSWRQELSHAMLAVAPKTPWDCPVKVVMTIYVPRPKNHYGQGRNAAVLKESAPTIPPTGKDLDKLARCAGDAGTGILWRDDARIAMWELRRGYADDGPERVEIEAHPL